MFAGIMVTLYFKNYILQSHTARRFHHLQCYFSVFPQMAWGLAAPMCATTARSALSEGIGRSASVRCVRPSSILSVARTEYPTATNANCGWKLVNTAARSRSCTRASAVSGSIDVTLGV